MVHLYSVSFVAEYILKSVKDDRFDIHIDREGKVILVWKLSFIYIYTRRVDDKWDREEGHFQ